MTARLALSFVAAAALVAASLPAPTLAASPTPTSTVIQSNLVVPWDLDFTPDGTMIVTERPGRIQIYASGAPGATLISTTEVPNVRAEHESGLNGIAIDTSFASNRFVYVCASRQVPVPEGEDEPIWVNQVLRYRMTPTRTLDQMTVIFTGGDAGLQHNGCSLEMDAAGLLWVGIGDGGVPSRAQDPTSLNGKILRITRGGAVPADNPIWTPAAQRTAVYSMGHRNPQGIAFAPGGQVYAAEHGPNVDDEINRIVPGANYGWPCYTGAGKPHMPAGCLPADAYSAPAWASGTPTIATSGMTFLDHPSWEDWNGSAVVSQLKQQDLRRFVSSNGGNTLTQADLLLDGDYGRLRAAVAAPDGSLYLTTSNGTGDRVIRVTPGDVLIERYAGVDRYATAAQVSSRNFAPGVPAAYVATGINYPDALAGGAAATRNGGPVLLVGSAGVPSATRAELLRLKPQRIVVLGGPGVISDAAMADLARYAPGGASRLYGTDRYATAAAISRATFPLGVPVAYVATGVDYPDALAGVPAAGVQGGPIVLVRPTALPGTTAAELGRLKPQRIVILGGTGAVNATVASQLQAYTPRPVERRSGVDRYATSVAISRATFGTGVPQVFIATGRNYPDGLTGGPAAARRGGPLLLVPGTSLPGAVSSELLRLDPRRVTILGGTGAVSDDVRAQINALLND